MTGTIGKKIIDRLTEFADALEGTQPVSEQFTCRQIVLRLEPQAYQAEDVKKTRGLLGVSQPLFAQFLGVSVQAVRAWEQGKTEPSVMACRFMDEIRGNPPYWKNRLQGYFENRTTGKAKPKAAKR